MRYGPEHKALTRKRIVEVAGNLFRRHGYNGVGIDRIMDAAQLTRGGFYGYFDSKAALFAQVISTEHGFNALMKRRTGTLPAELTEQALEIVEGYLHPHNRDEIGAGCSMASLSVDVARAGKPAKEAFSRKLRDLAREFARGLDDTPDLDAADLDARALTAIALCVGGAVLARASNDEDLVNRLSEACRAAVTRELRAA